MINTKIATLPAYTTRDFRNFGLHKANSLYKFMFTVQDITLLNTGAVKLFPTSMCKYTSIRDVNLNSRKYCIGEEVDIKEFDEKTLFTLIKTSVLNCELKEEFAQLDETKLIQLVNLYDCVGKTFKTTSASLNLDFNKIKEKFELKQGGASKKVKLEDVNKLQELLLEV